MNNQLKVGQLVEAERPCVGIRQGRIVEIDATGRCRVMWLNRDGSNDKRTWVRPTAFRVVA